MKRFIGIVIVSLFLVSSMSLAAAPKKVKTSSKKGVDPILAPVPAKKAAVVKVATKEAVAAVPAPAADASAAFLSSLSVSGSLRVRYSSYAAANIPDTLGLSRARIKITGKITPDFSFLIQPDFAALSTGGTVAVADAYAEYICPNSGIVSRFGQFLVPFGYDSAKYKTIFGTGLNPNYYNVIVSARDYGIRAKSAVPYLPAGFGIDAALVNGGGGGTDNNKAKDIVARANYKNDFIDVGLSGYYGYAGATSLLKKDAGIDVEYKAAPYLAVAEYMLGQNIAASAKVQDAYLQVSGLFGEHEPLLKYETYDPNTTVSGDSMNTVTVGYTYLLNKATKIVANYNIVGEETNQVNNDTLFFELQTSL